MSRVITFSRVFPAYHPRKGQDTTFVEQIWNGLNELKLPVPKNKDLPDDFMWSILPLSNFGSKYHTVRNGDRWKIGDKFSPRVWSGKPYASKQIIIAPDIEVKKIFKISSDGALLWIDNQPVISTTITGLATNDGLGLEDFLDWFKMKPFLGQIICWNHNINY